MDQKQSLGNNFYDFHDHSLMRQYLLNESFVQCLYNSIRYSFFMFIYFREWRPFRISSRNDNAVFHHWKKVGEKQDGNCLIDFSYILDYHFTRFNKKITIFEYTDEQYEKYFVGNFVFVLNV